MEMSNATSSLTTSACPLRSKLTDPPRAAITSQAEWRHLSFFRSIRRLPHDVGIDSAARLVEHSVGAPCLRRSVRESALLDPGLSDLHCSLSLVPPA
jgi:hypothetical protein